MPYFATSQEWLRQSALLLEARPTTTRITTNYNIAKPKARRPSSKSKSSEGADDTTSSTTTTPKPPRGNLVIKTFDPVSGTTLKYRTTKAAEVGRLVLCLGRLGTRMTGLPGDSADVEVPAAGAAAAGAAGGEDVAMADDGAETPAPAAAVAPPPAAESKTTGGGGGKGKKKKGKK